MFRSGDLASAIKLCEANDYVGLSNMIQKNPKLAKMADRTGNTLLHVASHKGQLDHIMMLLLHGSNVNASDKSGFTPLMVALQFLHGDAANFLVESGASVSDSNSSKHTPLHIATVFGCVDSVVHLLQAGANANAQDIYGNTPVMCSATRGYQEILSRKFNFR